MQIYLARPGGQKEGPFTVEQINRDIADGKYGDSEFWAWHEGLPRWIPLYSIDGVSRKKPGPTPAPAPARETQSPAAEAKPAAKPETKPIEEPRAIAPVSSATSEEPAITATGSSDVATASAEMPAAHPLPARAVAPAKPSGVSSIETVTASTEPEPLSVPEKSAFVAPNAVEKPAEESLPVETAENAEPDAELEKANSIEVVPDAIEPAVSDDPLVPPFSQLEQIFVFTTGDGPSVFNLKSVNAILEETVGKSIGLIRQNIPVDVVGRSDTGAVRAMGHGLIPDSVWRALSVIKPAVAQQARDGAFNLQLRTGSAETNDKIAALFLYRKPGK